MIIHPLLHHTLIIIQHITQHPTLPHNTTHNIITLSHTCPLRLAQQRPMSKKTEMYKMFTAPFELVLTDGRSHMIDGHATIDRGGDGRDSRDGKDRDGASLSSSSAAVATTTQSSSSVAATATSQSSSSSSSSSSSVPIKSRDLTIGKQKVAVKEQRHGEEKESRVVGSETGQGRDTKSTSVAVSTNQRRRLVVSKSSSSNDNNNNNNDQTPSFSSLLPLPSYTKPTTTSTTTSIKTIPTSATSTTAKKRSASNSGSVSNSGGRDSGNSRSGSSGGSTSTSASASSIGSSINGQQTTLQYSVQTDLSHVMADLRYASQCIAMVGCFDSGFAELMFQSLCAMNPTSQRGKCPPAMDLRAMPRQPVSPPTGTISGQHTLSNHPLNLPSQPSLSIHPVNTPSQTTLLIHPLNPAPQSTLSIYPLTPTS